MTAVARTGAWVWAGSLVAHLLASPLAAAPGFTVALEPLRGHGVAEPGETLRLRIALVDDATGYPLAGLRPQAWLRPAGVRPAVCKEAIAALRQGSGRSLGVQDLNRPALIVLHSDQTIGLVDPGISLATSNLLWLRPLPGTPVAWAVDNRQATLSLLLHEPAELVTLDLHSGSVLWRLDGVSPVGLALSARDGLLRLLDAEGVRILELEPARGALRRALTIPSTATAFAADDVGQRLFLLVEDGAAVLELDLASGEIVDRYALGAQASQLLYIALADAIALGSPEGPRLLLGFVDGSRRFVDVALAGGVDQLALTPDQRWLFALDRSKGTVSIVDLARLRLHQALEVPGRVDRLQVTGRYLYVREIETPRYALLPLASLAGGTTAGLVELHLESKPPRADTPEGLPVVAAWPQGGAVMLSQSERTLFLYAETGMQAPSDAVRLRAAAPVAVAVFDRRLREAWPGVYETTVRVAGRGAWELVLQLTQPDFIACHPLTQMGEGKEPAPRASEPKLILIPPERARAGEPLALHLEMHDGDTSVPLPPPSDLVLLVLREGDNWFARLWPRLREQDAVAEFQPPRPGRYRVFAESESLGLKFESVALPSFEVLPAGVEP